MGAKMRTKIDLSTERKMDAFLVDATELEIESRTEALRIFRDLCEYRNRFGNQERNGLCSWLLPVAGSDPNTVMVRVKLVQDCLYAIQAYYVHHKNDRRNWLFDDQLTREKEELADVPTHPIHAITSMGELVARTKDHYAARQSITSDVRNRKVKKSKKV